MFPDHTRCPCRHPATKKVNRIGAEDQLIRRVPARAEGSIEAILRPRQNLFVRKSVSCQLAVINSSRKSIMRPETGSRLDAPNKTPSEFHPRSHPSDVRSHLGRPKIAIRELRKPLHPSRGFSGRTGARREQSNVGQSRHPKGRRRPGARNRQLRNLIKGPTDLTLLQHLVHTTQ